jgi:hypothetical protein
MPSHMSRGIVYIHDAANIHQNTLYIGVYESALYMTSKNSPLSMLIGMNIPCQNPESHPYVCPDSMLQNKKARNTAGIMRRNKQPSKGASIPHMIEIISFFILLFVVSSHIFLFYIFLSQRYRIIAKSPSE